MKQGERDGKRWRRDKKGILMEMELLSEAQECERKCKARRRRGVPP